VRLVLLSLLLFSLNPIPLIIIAIFSLYFNTCANSPKNYQLWYHRRALLEIRFGGEAGDALLEVAKKELDYIDKILEDDSKNYHVSMSWYCYDMCLLFTRI
jgi:hypothetical protein